MSVKDEAAVDRKRRRLLISATTLVAGTGFVAVTIPLIESMLPSARAKAAGAPIDVDFSKLEPGQQITLAWRGKPVWVLRRTLENLADLKRADLREHLRDPDSDVKTQQAGYAQNEFRSIKTEYMVVIGICTHLGCAPTYRPDRVPEDLGADWLGGYFCPCHGSRFDLAGRVYKGVPAPTNLVVPPYRFISENQVRIGENTVKSS